MVSQNQWLLTGHPEFWHSLDTVGKSLLGNNDKLRQTVSICTSNVHQKSTYLASDSRDYLDIFNAGNRKLRLVRLRDLRQSIQRRKEQPDNVHRPSNISD